MLARDLGHGVVGGHNASDALQNEVRLTSINVGGGNLNVPILSDRRETSTFPSVLENGGSETPRKVSMNDANSASAIRKMEEEA
jgi:hypothetical protein